MSSPEYPGGAQITVDAALKTPKVQLSRARKVYVGFSGLYAKRKAGKRKAKSNPQTPPPSPQAASGGGAYPEYPFQ